MNVRPSLPQSAKMQHTLGDRIDLSGIGVHSGKPVTMSLTPADPDTGVVFSRSLGEREYEIPAVAASVGATELCTVLGDPKGVFVATVEHLLAAVSALGVDNMIAELDGPEVPVMDGSSDAFVDAIDQVGLERQDRHRRQIRVTKAVRVEHGESFAEFEPHPTRVIEAEIDYDCPVIGRQALSVELDATNFRDGIARARTFGYMRDVERLWAAGFALGSSLENSVVIGEDGPVNPEGLRFEDEFVRHKVLDAIGDLALAGAAIVGRYRSYKGGHRLNAMALAALLEDELAYVYESLGPPAKTGESRVDLTSNVSVAAFAPERS